MGDTLTLFFGEKNKLSNYSANAMDIKLLASVAEGGKPCLTSGEHSEPEGGNEQ